MILHEIGHLFGLSDEYEELSRCPNRRFVSIEQEYTNVMKTVRESFDWMDFYPRHITRILEPICGGAPHLGTIRTLEGFRELFRDAVWTQLGVSGESYSIFPESLGTFESPARNLQVAFRTSGLPYLLYPAPEVWPWRRSTSREISPSKISSGAFQYRVWDSQVSTFFYVFPRD